MPFVQTDEVRLYVEEVGDGYPILFLHEFADDHRCWRPQVEHFASSFRCVSYAARGYPPSDVPVASSSYSQAHAVADALGVMDALAIARAHVVGLSMGAFCGLHVALQRPDRVSALVAASIGYGAEPLRQKGFREDCERTATSFLSDGAARVASATSMGPARIQLRKKSPQAWADFAARMSGHSALGSALTMRGVQARRPSLFDLQEELRRLRVPTLLMLGDQDEPARAATLMLARTIPGAALTLVPGTGHLINLEEPGLFNARVHDFFTHAELPATGE